MSQIFITNKKSFVLVLNLTISCHQSSLFQVFNQNRYYIQYIAISLSGLPVCLVSYQYQLYRTNKGWDVMINIVAKCLLDFILILVIINSVANCLLAYLTCSAKKFPLFIIWSYQMLYE